MKKLIVTVVAVMLVVSAFPASVRAGGNGWANRGKDTDGRGRGAAVNRQQPGLRRTGGCAAIRLLVVGVLRTRCGLRATRGLPEGRDRTAGSLRAAAPDGCGQAVIWTGPRSAVFPS